HYVALRLSGMVAVKLHGATCNDHRNRNLSLAADARRAEALRRRERPPGGDHSSVRQVCAARQQAEGSKVMCAVKIILNEPMACPEGGGRPDASGRLFNARWGMCRGGACRHEYFDANGAPKDPPRYYVRRYGNIGKETEAETRERDLAMFRW